MKHASIALLLAIAPETLLAQEAKPFQNFPKDQLHIWTSPLRVERKQLPWLIAFGAGAAALIAADKHISNQLPNSESQIRWGTRLSRTGSSYGVLAIGGGLFAASAIRHDTRMRRTAFASLESLGNSLALTYGLKLITSRERPGSGSGQGHFWSGYGDAFGGNKSFPSGHAMESWAVASVIAHEYKDKAYVPWLAYGFASMVSASRVAAQRHYVSDVAIGATAGYLIGKLVHNRYAPQPNGGKFGWLRPAIQPTIQPSSGTMALSLRWGK
jgi:membrane-associated phospholipid phosphatase